MSDFIMMVGLPGCGKSNFVDNMRKSNPKLFEGEFPQCVVISLDNNVLELGGDISQDSYTKYREHAQALVLEQLQDAFSNDQSIIVDMSKVSRIARKKYGLETAIDYGYKCTAIVFNLTDVELKRRFNKRHAETGKDVPFEVLSELIVRCQMPTTEEGFDQISVITE